MKTTMSFNELDQLATDHLQAMLATGRLSDENRKRISYEIRIRNIELPKELKLKTENKTQKAFLIQTHSLCLQNNEVRVVNKNIRSH